MPVYCQHLGLPIRGNLRIQLNMEIQPYTSMESFANVPNLMLPILWAEEVRWKVLIINANEIALTDVFFSCLAVRNGDG